jgi:hypothetical protein
LLPRRVDDASAIARCNSQFERIDADTLRIPPGDLDLLFFVSPIG